MKYNLPLTISLLLLTNSYGFAAPPLPSGLNNDKPQLPAGLKSSPNLPSGLNNDKPSLPSGLSGLTVETTVSEELEAEPFMEVSGFWDIRGGVRLPSNPYEDQFALGESRLQIELQKEMELATVNVTADFIYDALAPNHKINLDTGQGWIDLREANVAFSPLSFMDVKVGRQILTWGTGDLIFINDLFPKDWQAFFIGRNVEYLKAPSDAVKTSMFSDYVNIDVIFTPQFDADRSITGERISYYNPMLGETAGNNAVVNSRQPTSAEWALRLYQNIGVNELALYAYDGFWKSPAGFDPSTNQAVHPDLRSIGASLRRPLWQGITNVELGYYHSKDSNNANNPLAQNSEMRFLLGYEQEVMRNVSIGVQYYVEWMQDYQNYQNNLATSATQRDEVRHLITSRLTWLTLNQNLNLSLFSFYSPSDQDAYFRPKASYKVTDAWLAEIGGNFFVGKNNYSFFGQFEENNNIYGAIRYSF